MTIGFAMTGSFCTFAAILPQLRALCESYTVLPLLSENAAGMSTRFGSATEIRETLKEITGSAPLCTIAQAEPIGPQKLLDALVVAPCTGNTLGKLAGGITDSAVTMAAKAHLRNERPLLLGISTNDALGASAANLGRLLNSRNVYFIPMRQDDPMQKPRSVVADFVRLPAALEKALAGEQIQPIFC